MDDAVGIREIPGDVRGHVLRISGRLDAKSAQLLVQQCQGLLDRNVKNVVLTMSDVSFVASSGIGSLLALTESFKDAGGDLRLAHLSNAVSSVVTLLNLGQFLAIDATEEDALASIGA
ncbi:STAS domain-containing protein [bacterium]|nr:STAS domain-containing protein [bacterium]